MYNFYNRRTGFIHPPSFNFPPVVLSIVIPSITSSFVSPVIPFQTQEEDEYSDYVDFVGVGVGYH